MLICVVVVVYLSRGVKFVSPCYRRWRNNLNEPLDPYPFWVAAEEKGGQG